MDMLRKKFKTIIDQNKVAAANKDDVGKSAAIQVGQVNSNDQPTQKNKQPTVVDLFNNTNNRETSWSEELQALSKTNDDNSTEDEDMGDEEKEMSS